MDQTVSARRPSTGIVVSVAGPTIAIALASGVWIGLVPSWMAPLTVFLAALTIIVGLRMDSLSRGRSGPRLIHQSAENPEDLRVDLGVLCGADLCPGQRKLTESLDDLMCLINEDISVLQRSAKKFDLFSADIHFSAQNLSSQAANQLQMLATLRESTTRFFETMNKASVSLASLRDTVHDNSASSMGLRDRAMASKQDLADVVGRTRSTARDARTGVDEVEATFTAAAELERILGDLSRTARRESEEAGHIAQSIATITDIVERTHVLATNASIEAARAGSRGAGFAVIAQEVRTLAAASRSALEDMNTVLGSVKSGIDKSTAMVAVVAASASRLGESLGRTRNSFLGIGSSVLDIEERINRFDDVFAGQIEGATSAAAFAERTATTLEGFGDEFRSNADDYEAIVRAARSSEELAADSRRAARYLAQLAGYLKAGGTERNRVLRRYQVHTDAGQRRFDRKERREDLLYNLEVYDHQGELIGHLGNLSRSGLQLLSAREFSAGQHMSLTIALPMTLEGEKRLDLKVIIRRTEKDIDGNRIGCQIEGTSQSGVVDEILATLAIGNIAAPGSDTVTGEPVQPGPSPGQNHKRNQSASAKRARTKKKDKPAHGSGPMRVPSHSINSGQTPSGAFLDKGQSRDDDVEEAEEVEEL